MVKKKHPVNITTVCPLEAIGCTLAFAPKDWGIDKSDAWIYGIVAGWDNESLAELKEKFRWTAETVDRLKNLHKAFNELRIQRGKRG